MKPHIPDTGGQRRAGTAPIVGIPRGLLYFRYAPFWITYLSHLGAVVRVSEPTDAADLQRAQALTQSDLCLPVKVFLNHVAGLRDHVDWLLLPRIVSVAPDAYFCPKILGVPDMVRNVVSDLPPLLDPTINVKLRRPHTFKAAHAWVGSRFTRDPRRRKAAWAVARGALSRFRSSLLTASMDEALGPWDGSVGRVKRRASPGRYRIAVIGRPYVIFDSALSHDLLRVLTQHGATYVTAESLPPAVMVKNLDRLPKKVYWEVGKVLVAAAFAYAAADDVDAIINVAVFGCGQDAFIGALVEHHVVSDANKPFLNLDLDEHADGTALTTRIEALLDMVDQRRRNAPRRPLPAAPPKARAASLGENTLSAEEFHLTVPHMGHLHIGFEKVFKDLGVVVTMPPRPNKEALLLGTRHAPEGACLPFKLNLGNMIQALEEGATHIMVAGGYGPCRYGYYSVIQEQILRDLGYRFSLGRADDPDSLRDMLVTIKYITGLSSRWEAYRLFFFILRRLALVDWALGRAHRLRPRETERGATDHALRRSLAVVEETRRFRDLWRAKPRMRRLFAAVPVNRQRPILRVGVVGEIFMVLENFANMQVEERLGAMGVEVHRGVWLSDWLNDRFRFKPFRRNQHRWSLRLARPYLRDSCGGESVQSVGNSVWFARRGLDGIVHIMPFTCMPELVAQTILSRVGRESGTPILNLSFDEHTSAGAVQTRLEAFVDLMKRRP